MSEYTPGWEPREPMPAELPPRFDDPSGQGGATRCLSNHQPATRNSSPSAIPNPVAIPNLVAR